MSSRNRWINRLAKRSAVILAAAAATASFTNSLWAESGTFTYTAGATSWSNTNAWLFGNPAPNGLGSNGEYDVANLNFIDIGALAAFNIPITMSISPTLSRINFGDTNNASPGGWTLNEAGGSYITMQTASAAQPIIFVDNLGNSPTVSFAALNLDLRGSQGFVKSGGGILRLLQTNTFTGTITIQGGQLQVGEVANLNPVNSSIPILMNGGTLALRRDTTFDLSAWSMRIENNSAVYVDRSVAFNSTSSSQEHKIGTVIFGAGPRSLSVRGANLYSFHIDSILLDTSNTQAVINELTPGLLTVGSISTYNAVAPTTLIFGGTGDETGNNISVTNTIQQAHVSATLSVQYTDNHTFTLGSFVGPLGAADPVTGGLTISGGGTMLIQSGILPNGPLAVTGGTLDLTNFTSTSTVSGLTMGGQNGTGTNSLIDTGANATLALVGNITVNSAGGGVTNNGAVINGKLDLGSTGHSLAINAQAGNTNADLTINATVFGSGSLTKNNTGEMLFTAPNILTSSLLVNAGTVIAHAQATGNSMPSGQLTISGGNVRLLNPGVTPGAATISALSFAGDVTAPARLFIQGTAGTTLNIGTFLGREAGTSGALSIIPVNGPLDATEIVVVNNVASAIGPIKNHGILAPFLAVQGNLTDTTLDFLAVSANNHLVPAASAAPAVYLTSNLSTQSGGTAVFLVDGTVPTNLTASASVFALKAIGTTASLGGTGTLAIGDPLSASSSGIILDRGATIGPAHIYLDAQTNQIWGGGKVIAGDGTTVLAAGGTLTGLVHMPRGDVTVAGSETVTLSGGLELGLVGQTRTLTIADGTTVISGALRGGNLIKSGPRYLYLNGQNSVLPYTGTITTNSGTVQVGQSSLTPLANLGSASVVIGNGTFVLSLDGIRTLNNFITNTGTGVMYLTSPTATLRFNNPTLSYGTMIVTAGNVVLGGHNDLPTASNLTVTGTGSFDMRGFNQTLGMLAGNAGGANGTGVVTNGGAGISTLYLINNNTTVTPNYQGLITQGVGGIAIEKNGSGTQLLSGANTYTGGVKLFNGTLALGNNAAAGALGSIQFLGGALNVRNNVTLGASNSLSIGSGSGVISVGNANGEAATINSRILVSGGSLTVGWSNGTGQTLSVPQLPATDFNGTVTFGSANNGNFRITGNGIRDMSATTVDFGTNGVGTLTTQNGVTVNLGAVLGSGTNNGITGAGGTRWNIGNLGGNSVFNGIMSGNVTLAKVGTGNLTFLSRTSNYSNQTLILGGTLTVGQGAQLSGTPTITLNGGDLAIAGNGTLSGTTFLNLAENNEFNVTQAPNFSTSTSLTLQGNGVVMGAYTHGAGTLSPAGTAAAGTITFNSLANPGVLTMGAGAIPIDARQAGIDQVGGGTNDLIVVNGDLNMSESTLYLFNYINSTGTVAAGQDYPIIYYTGTKTGGTAGTISAPFHATFSLKEIGSNIVAIHVNDFDPNAPAANLTWTGDLGAPNQGRWDLNITKNFKNQLGVATTYFQDDTVTFDDAGRSHQTVILDRAIYLPSRIVFNNGSNLANNYVIQGAGTITGDTTVEMTGTGRVDFNSQNHTYTGGLILRKGTLATNGNGNRGGDTVFNSAFGSGTITVLNVDATATIQVNANNVVNNIVVPTGNILNYNQTGNGSGIGLKGNFIGGGEVRFYGGQRVDQSGDNTGFTGTFTFISPGQFSRQNSPLTGGGAFWNLISAAANQGLSWNFDDASNVEIPLGGIGGSGNLDGYRSGASYTGIKTLKIGSTGISSTWNGGINQASSGSGGNGSTNIFAPTNVEKVGTGTLTLTGVNISTTGTIMVSQGALVLANTGGDSGTARANGGRALNIPKVSAQSTGAFYLQSGGTLLTAATGLLMNASNGGRINVSGAYDTNSQPDPNDPENTIFTEFATAPGVTWAGVGGTIIGNIYHSAGTISPGADTGFGRVGTMSFSDRLDLISGFISVDVGNTTSNADKINATTLNLGGGTLIVNFVGPSAPGVNPIYTLMKGVSFIEGNIANIQQGGLILRGRNATGTLSQNTAREVILKMGTAASSAALTWTGVSGATWEGAVGNWKNTAGLPDNFYHGDTVSFNDSSGGGTVSISAQNVLPFGTVNVTVNTTTLLFAGNGKISGSAALAKHGTGTLFVMTDNDYTGGTTIDAGGTLYLGRNTMALYSPANATDLNGDLMEGNMKGSLGSGSIVNNGNLVIGTTHGNVFNQTISGTGAVIKTDYGWLTLNNTNSWTGGTTITMGAIKLGVDNALPNVGSVNIINMSANPQNNGGNWLLGNGGRLDLNTHSVYIPELNTFLFDVATQTYLPDSPAPMAYIINSATISSAISTLSIGSGNFHGAIKNGVEGFNGDAARIALTKLTTGVATIDLTSSGTIESQYTGNTNINGGTLILRGDHFPANRNLGTHTVANTAALAGDGTIGTRVDVLSGGILAPGLPDNTTGDPTMLLTMDTLSLTSGFLDYRIRGATTDLVNVVFDNGFIPQGVSQVRLNIVGGVNAGTFNLLQYNGASILDLLTKIQLQPGNITNASTFNYQLSNNTLTQSLELVVTQPLVTATWSLASAGSWGQAPNWTSNPTTPNAYGSIVNFGSTNAALTVTMDGPQQIGTANFVTSNGYTILGSDATTLTFGNLAIGGAVGINVTAGNPTINAPVVINNNATIQVLGGSNLSMTNANTILANGGGGGHTVTKTGAGNLTITGLRTTFGVGGTAALNVLGGNVIVTQKSAPNDSSGTSKVNSLSIAPGSVVDLKNNSFVIDYTGLFGAGSLLTNLQTVLRDGRLTSTATAPDTRNYRLGYRDNSDQSGSGLKSVSNFSGVVVDGSSLLVKYTFAGDTNLDSTVDINDLMNMATNYQASHAGGIGPKNWTQGDSNNDGWVDQLDLNLFARNWQGVLGVAAGGTATSLEPFLASLGLPSAAVPEPSTLGVVGLGLTGLLARRRRRQA